jgi:hypothetical protein
MFVKRRPFKVFFSLGNKKKPGEYGGWGITTVLLLAKTITNKQGRNLAVLE